jgi:hypothetical protein
LNRAQDVVTHGRLLTRHVAQATPPLAGIGRVGHHLGFDAVAARALQEVVGGEVAV